MNLIESIKSAFRSVFANKMRSFLTMLGIIIGISSVIMITSVGQGSQAALTGEFEKLGISMLTISMKSGNDTTAKDYLGLDDVDVIRSHPDVKNVTPVFQTGGASVKLRNPKETKDSIVIGVNSEYVYIGQPDMLHGRFFIEADEKAKSKVVVIDNGLAKSVFGREDVIGEKISVKMWRGTFNFTVIGIMNNPNAALEGLFGDQMPAYLYMPINTVQDMYGSDRVGSIYASIKDPNKMNDVAIEITRILERKHRNEDKYYVQNSASQLEQINNVLGIFTGFISFVAGISLLVGGVGVMNIMLVTVTERTREIGIRKSLGAKNKDIRIQFLIEAMILTIIGGIIGILLGYLGGFGIGSLMKITPKMSPLIVLGTVTISSIIGILFGVYPANKAAKLDPIEALRYE